MPSSKPPKKSEMLEVRLSYQDKQDLQQKAQADGLSVSEVVRQLISNYLVQPKPRIFPQLIMETIMRGHMKTKSALTAAGILIFGAFALSPLSSAEDIGLKLQGTAVQPVVENGETGLRTRRFETEVHLDDGKSVSFGLDGSNLKMEDFSGSNLETDGLIEGKADDLIIVITAKHVENKVHLEMKIHMNTPNSDGQLTKLVANPKLTASFDEKSTIELELENNQVFNLVVTPTKLEKSG